MPPSAKTASVKSLKEVIDPELFVNIVDLGLIYLVTVTEGGRGEVEGRDRDDDDQSRLSGRSAIDPEFERRAGPDRGGDEVEVKLVMTPPWTPDRMTEDARDQLGIF